MYYDMFIIVFILIKGVDSFEINDCKIHRKNIAVYNPK
jgi:hypothetical protein